ncbi:MAG TPA: ABC transporter permease [Gemmatimonadales bacterium]|nr:ABC transporter permease [Gemmatimonadales bacterium]
MNPGRLAAIARKEITQIRRDPRSLALAFVLPMLLVVFFSYAISFDVNDIRMAVVDQDRTPQSRALTAAFVSSGYFTVHASVDGVAEAEARLVDGSVRLVLVIPPTFARDLAARRPAPVQLLLDGSDANTATIAQNYADGVVTGFSVLAAADGRRIVPPLSAESRVWYNETLESRNMVVPGLIAVLMSIIAALLTALTIAREWERGTMEQLAATPVHRIEVVLGKLVPYVGIGLVDVALAVLAGLFIFDVPFRGNVLLLGLMTLLFLVGALGLGMFVSAALKSQLLATQVAILATYLPALILSGFIFSLATMPLPLRAISTIVPARYFITVTRGVFLKGVGLDVLWPQALAMILFTVVGLGLATRLFRKEIG